MPGWIWMAIAATVVADIVVIALVARKKGFAKLTQVHGFAKVAHPRIEEYMRCNYSGDPRDLDRALTGLRDHLRTVASQENCTIDDETLCALIGLSVTNLRIAKRADVDAALSRLAEPRAAAA